MKDFYIDDLYVCDGQGASNNDFLGDCGVDSYLPMADGANTGLTPCPRTAHFSLVDEATPNDDTDFNESANPRGQGHLGVCGHGPQCCEHRRCPVNLNVDAGLRQVKDVVRSAAPTTPKTAAFPRCRARSPEDRWVAQQVLGSPRSRVWPLGVGVTISDGGDPPTHERSLGLRGRLGGKIRFRTSSYPFIQTGSPAEVARQIPISINKFKDPTYEH